MCMQVVYPYQLRRVLQWMTVRGYSPARDPPVDLPEDLLEPWRQGWCVGPCHRPRVCFRPSVCFRPCVFARALLSCIFTCRLAVRTQTRWTGRTHRCSSGTSKKFTTSGGRWWGEGAQRASRSCSTRCFLGDARVLRKTLACACRMSDCIHLKCPYSSSQSCIRRLPASVYPSSYARDHA